MSGGARGPEDGPLTPTDPPAGRDAHAADAAVERDGSRGGRRIELSGTEVAGAALATVTVTVFTSYLGALGTLTGAAVMSVVSSVGASVYKHYLRRGRDRLRDARTFAETVSLRRTGRAHSTGGPATADPAATDQPAAIDPATPPSSAADAGSSTGTTPAARETASAGSEATAAGATDQDTGVRGTTSSRGGRWRYAALAVGVFVLVMGGVTGYEAFAGKSLSSVVKGDEGSGTTLGDLGRGGSGPGDGPADDTPTPEPGSTTEPEGDGSETTPDPSESVPSTGGPSTGAPTPEPTDSQESPSLSDDGARGDPNGQPGRV